jgi:Aspartyl protease
MKKQSVPQQGERKWSTALRAVITLTMASAIAGCTCESARTSDATIIPISINDRLPYVEAEIGGKRIALRFDTGAFDSGIALMADDMKRLNVESTGVAKSADAMGNIFEVRTFVVPEVRIGGLTLRNVPGNEMMYASDTTAATKSGHIGLASLRNNLLVVNLAQRQIEVRKSGDFPKICGSTDTKLVIGEFGVASRATSDIGSFMLGWDAAAQANIISPSALKLSSGQYQPGDPRQIALAFDPMPIKPVPFRLVNIDIPGLDGLIGHDYFMTHVVCLDIPARKLRLQ